jgi:hypothetical protein
MTGKKLEYLVGKRIKAHGKVAELEDAHKHALSSSECQNLQVRILPLSLT